MVWFEGRVVPSSDLWDILWQTRCTPPPLTFTIRSFVDSLSGSLEGRAVAFDVMPRGNRMLLWGFSSWNPDDDSMFVVGMEMMGGSAACEASPSEDSYER